MNELNELVGKTIQSVIGGIGSDELLFKCSDGTAYRMHHRQDCCERVELIDIIGDMENMLNTPIVMSECVINQDDEPDNHYADELQQWTFYKFATIKGYVTLRWFGSSNGYYSVDVDFDKVDVSN